MSHLLQRVLTRPASTLITEVLAATKAAVYYPLGLSDSVCDRFSAPRWHVLPAVPTKYPVLLVHGIWHNQSWALRLERTLEELGYVCWSVNYRTIGRDVDDAAAQVAAYVRTLAAQQEVEKVHVVAHSLGGLVLREAVACHGIDHLVAAAVTIGSPHTGSPLAFKALSVLPALGDLISQIRPGSSFLRELDAQTGPSQASWTAIYSTGDEIVPGRHGRLDHPALGARNVELRSIGHLALMFHSAVRDVVLGALSESEVTDPSHLGLPA